MLTETFHLYDDRPGVTLTTYILSDSPELLNGQKRPAILICPGGAYLGCSDREAEPVALRFNAYRARWLRQEIWHPEQRLEEQPDGSLIMRFLVTDFREVKLRVMQYGAEVEVLAPLELWEEIRTEIGRMVRLYGGGWNFFWVVDVRCPRWGGNISKQSAPLDQWAAPTLGYGSSYMP